MALALVLGVSLNDAAAQDQRIVEVPSGFGTLNDAVQGDTTATGARVDSNTVYVLERNGRYLLNGRLRHSGYHLHIRAAEGDGAPPIVQPGVRESGTADNPLMALAGDFTLEGLWILNQSDAGAKNSNGIAIGAEGITGRIDNCIFEVATWLGIRINLPNSKLYVTNSIIRNLIRIDDPGNGKFLDPRGTNQELMYLENNTFYNMTSEIVRESGALIRNFFFNHNTVYNVGAISRNDARVNLSRIVNGTFANNQFINIAPLGDITTDWDYFGGEIEGRTDSGSLFPLDSLKADDLGIAETDRNVVIANNNFHWDTELLNYFDTIDTVQVFSILSPLAEDFVDAGLVTLAANLDEDVEFANAPDVQRAIGYSQAWYTTFCDDDPPLETCDFQTNPAEWDPLVSVAAMPWPIPEDFSYPTTAASYTGGTGGFPVGDLNWFPEQKAAWIAAGGGNGTVVGGLPTPIEDLGNQPSAFRLRGNYPNPFNPVTSVVFDLDRPADVTVRVYDLMGRNVLELPTLRLTAGTGHAIQVEASSLSSGIYFYEVDARIGTTAMKQTGKMVLLK